MTIIENDNSVFVMFPSQSDKQIREGKKNCSNCKKFFFLIKDKGVRFECAECGECSNCDKWEADSDAEQCLKGVKPRLKKEGT